MRVERKTSRRGLLRATGIAGAAFAMAIGAAGPVAAEPAGAEIVQADRHIEGSYIVVLKDGVQATSSPEAIEQASASLAERYGGALNDTYTATIQGFSVQRMSQGQAERLAADPSVRTVYEDGTAQVADTQPNPPSWGQDRVDQRESSLDDSYTYNNTASDITAYVIDTGIAPSNPEWEGRASYGYDFVDDDSEAQDCNGHGSHVAGTIGGKTYGLAKKVDIVAVRSLGCGGSAPDSATVSSMEWVAQNGTTPAVVNMSLGMDTTGVGDEQVKALVDKGFVVAVAAGNSSADACDYSPARVPEALTVGMTDQGDGRNFLSNYGSCLDLFAPGGSIVSTGIDGGSSTMTGTSMASPHVAGAAAMYLQTDKSATPAKVAQEITGNATSGAVGNPGSGSPNKLLYTGFIGGGGDPDPEPGEFGVSVSPSSVEVEAGGYASATVSTTAGEQGPEDIELSASGLPSGAEAVFQPSSLTTGDKAKVTLDTASSTPEGSYEVTVTGTGSSGSNSATLTLTVGDGSEPPDEEVQVSLSPASGSVQQGFLAQTQVSASGGSGNLTLSADAPSGISVQFDPGTIGNGGSATAWIWTSFQTPPGSHEITITATDGSGATGSATYTLTVTRFG
ncbi:S8 family serine peptidase [Amycolatopsis cihanbeyliensis]|uniref:Subtilisin family serine protease n=1 Tax=Amycolatopsis cihanbeyliensis TaxID=1128664 RepID=A0A542DGN5_AMYCI|nr:S8 family serine peptidase [Amycolatopsis cihanbeyliensis]TQJ02245.1 subtilisin family serine protease [Amycolatopsis cihanbeyliensis]